MLRGAMVGLGQVGLLGHLPAWQKRSDFQIAAGVDFSDERTALFQKSLPQARIFKTLEDCLSKTQLDFVDIATPPHTHFNLARAALRSGLHVLCEKPLVLKREDLVELAAEQSQAGKILMTVHNWKFAPICRKLAELLDQGAIGKVNRLDWYVLRSGPAATTEGDQENWRLDPERAGGGILIDHGWHAFYLVLEWLKLKPSKISAALEKRQYESLSVEDTAKVRIEFNGGSQVAEIFLTWASRLRKNSGLAEGSLGQIHIEDDRLILNKKNAPPETIPFESPLSAGSHHPDWFGFVIDEFLSELSDPALSGRNFRTAQMCLNLVEKAKESSGKGTLVPV